MSSKIGGKGKVLVALIALVFALVMDGHHVAFQIGGKAEGLSAEVALVNRSHFFWSFQRHTAGIQVRPH